MSARPAHQPSSRHASPIGTETTPDQEELAPTNRRENRRQVVAELSWLGSLRIKYGPQVTLLDLSPDGAQIEIVGYRLQPGSTVVLEFTIAGEVRSHPAQVLRSQITSLTPHAIYRGALLFRRPFTIPTATEIANDVASDPASEFARLNLALERVASTGDPADLTGGRMTLAGARALDAALALVRSSPGENSADAFAAATARLLRETAQGVEQAAAPEAIVAAMVERLRRSIPSLAVRIVGDGPGTGVPAEAVRFQIPVEHGEPSAHLVVELAKDCGLDEWHLPYLEFVAQLIGGIRTLAAAA